jgi:mannose/fructose-specific phosphotransferase system component IIA
MRDYGVVLAAHGPLAAAARHSLEMLVGPVEGLETVALVPGMSREDMRRALEAAAVRLAAYPKLLVLCDLVGGTPCNAALELASANPRWQVVGGANMALLCELAAVDRLTPAALGELLEAGHAGLSDEGARLRTALGAKACAAGETDL